MVAVLLLVGVFFAGSIDAVACEPLFEEAAHAASGAHEGRGNESTPSTEKHGLCAHGHCHHGVQLVQVDAVASDLLLDAAGYRAAPAGPLASTLSDGLKRPPRV